MKNRNIVTRLGTYDWDVLYDPLPRRMPWAGQSDGALEFDQKPSIQSYWYDHGHRGPVHTCTEDILRAQQGSDDDSDLDFFRGD